MFFRKSCKIALSESLLRHKEPPESNSVNGCCLERQVLSWFDSINHSFDDSAAQQEVKPCPSSCSGPGWHWPSGNIPQHQKCRQFFLGTGGPLPASWS